MKIKLDHNLSRHLRDALGKFGHDVDTAFDEGLAGATDKEVLHEASEQSRILFTLDADFLNLKHIHQNRILV
jgi:predicted nuclease of predicted toxin-antitoxin system